MYMNCMLCYCSPSIICASCVFENAVGVCIHISIDAGIRVMCSIQIEISFNCPGESVDRSYIVVQDTSMGSMSMRGRKWTQTLVEK
jgi:hypothetical protein